MRTLCLTALLAIFFSAAAYGLDDVENHRKEAQGLSTGDRIAFWAELFVGTPYDPDPMGEYVTGRKIVADERVDCMYLTFRSVELALSDSAAESVAVALTKRFHTKGKLGEGGQVLNYGERYEYGMDMIKSGKWGADVTAALGGATRVPGERGIKEVLIISKDSLTEEKGPAGSISAGGIYGRGFRSGDIVYFIKDPSKRVVGEVVGHIGILKRDKDGEVYLIHASGSKGRGGVVKKVSFAEYISAMRFAGVKISRFD